MNRTTSVIIHRDIKHEFQLALKGKPFVGHEELTFAGRTLAVKWLLNHFKKIAQDKAVSEVYFKFWNNDHSYDVKFYKVFPSSNVDDWHNELKEFANDKNEHQLDLEYVKNALTN